MELCDLSAFEIATKVKRGILSASEVLDSALERIQLVDGRPGSLEPGDVTAEDQAHVHAFITRTVERARQQARQVDAKLAAG